MKRSWWAAAIIVVAGCTATGSVPSTSPTTPSPAASTSPAAPRTPEPTPTPVPDGLEPRPGRPVLIDGQADACVPGCGVGRVAGGTLPDGRYQTRWFFGGFLTIETDGTWSLIEDSNAELSLPTDGNYSVAFLLDPELVLHGVVADGLERQASSYVDWLSRHPDLEVSAPQPVSVDSVPAIAVDIRLATGAGQDAQDCGTDPCIAFIRNPAIPREYAHVDGILGDDVYRFVFADVAYSGTDHLFVVKVEGRDEGHLRSVLPRIDALLTTVTIPAAPR